MGRTTTPTYRVEYRDNLLAMGRSLGEAKGACGKPCHFHSWKGGASPARLEDWRKAMNASFAAGGNNEHISLAFNAIPHIFYAAIVRQADGKVIAEANAPIFEVV